MMECDRRLSTATCVWDDELATREDRLSAAAAPCACGAAARAPKPVRAAHPRGSRAPAPNHTYRATPLP